MISWELLKLAASVVDSGRLPSTPMAATATAAVTAAAVGNNVNINVQ